MPCFRSTILSLLLAVPAATFALPIDIDTHWASNGTYTLNDRTMTATAIDANGKLLLAGRTSTGIYVRRLNADGSPDSGFASTGTLEITLTTPACSDRPVLLLPLADGSFYLAENPASAASATPDFILRRISHNGVVDTGFGGNNGMTGPGKIRDISLDASGRIYVFADTHDAVAGDHWLLTRYLPTATLDSSYGSAGSVSGTGLTEAMTQLSGERMRILYDNQDAVDIAAKEDLKDVVIDAAGNMGVISHITYIYLGVAPYGVTLTAAPTNTNNIEYEYTELFFNSQNFTFTASNGSSYSKLRENGTAAATAYPDGWIQFIKGELYIKFSLSLGDDPSWHDNSGAPAENLVGTTAVVDAFGGVFIGGNQRQYDPATDNGVIQYATPATITRIIGSSPDTAPGAIATPQIQSNGTYYQTSTAITINHLGSNDFVPARLSFGELSTDAGSTWRRGWVWVKNDSHLLVRYPVSDPTHPGQPVTATLTVGGYLSPNNPALTLGDVLTVAFSNDSATVTPAAAAAADKNSAASSSGGSMDIFMLPFLMTLLMALLKTRGWTTRRRSAHAKPAK